MICRPSPPGRPNPSPPACYTPPAASAPPPLPPSEQRPISSDTHPQSPWWNACVNYSFFSIIIIKNSLKRATPLLDWIKGCSWLYPVYLSVIIVSFQCCLSGKHARCPGAAVLQALRCFTEESTQSTDYTEETYPSTSKSPEFKMQKMGAVTDKSLYLTLLGC